MLYISIVDSQKTDIKKFLDKALYKYAGKLKDVEIINRNLIQFVCYKGNIKDNKIVAFLSNDQAVINRMCNSAPRSRHKLKFKVICKEYNGRYYNNLYVVEANDWPVSSKKIQYTKQSDLFGHDWST